MCAKKTLTPLEQVLAKGHKLPKTRREFISHGLVSGVSTVAMPSILTMIARSNNAFAEELACKTGSTFEAGLPYICIDVGGGCNIAGQNAIVSMTKGSKFQEDAASRVKTDFIRLGITPEEAPVGANYSTKVETKYGLHFHRASGILDGMRSVLEPAGAELTVGEKEIPISNCIDGLVFCTRTDDDSATNPINTVYQANLGGAKGQLVELVGTNTTLTGARSAAVASQIDTKLRPTAIRSFDNARGLLSLGPKLSSNEYLNQSTEKIKAFMNRVAMMNTAKVDELKNKGSIGQLETVLKCSSQEARKLFEKFSSAELDPGTDITITNNFTNESQGAVAKLVLDNIAGAGTINLGGGDYHGGSAMGTHATDRRTGELIGRLIKTASEKSKNMVIHLYTDGGVAGDAGGLAEAVTIPGQGDVPKVRWTGDSGTRSAALMIVYKHENEDGSLVKETDGKGERQVGGFVPAGGVDLSTTIGDSTQNLWKAIMINYLALQGKNVEEEFSKSFKGEELPNNWEELIRFKAIA